MPGAVVNVKPPVEPVGVTVKPIVWLLSLGGPLLMLVAKLATVTRPASSLLLVVAGRLKLGASLIGLTVMVKVWAALVLEFGAGALRPLSVSVTLYVAVPLALAAAV